MNKLKFAAHLVVIIIVTYIMWLFLMLLLGASFMTLLQIVVWQVPPITQVLMMFRLCTVLGFIVATWFLVEERKLVADLAGRMYRGEA